MFSNGPSHGLPYCWELKRVSPQRNGRREGKKWGRARAATALSGKWKNFIPLSRRAVFAVGLAAVPTGGRGQPLHFRLTLQFDHSTFPCCSFHLQLHIMPIKMKDCYNLRFMEHCFVLVVIFWGKLNCQCSEGHFPNLRMLYLLKF